MVRMIRAAAALAIAVAGGPALGAPSHGLSPFGDLKYGPEFAHFDYVRPDAPKGGRIVTIGTSGPAFKAMGVQASITFDSLNPFILKGVPPQQIYLLFDSLMEPAADEPGAVYGLVAQSADLADDKMSVSFTLRPEARFSNGQPVTADDVVTTFKLLKEQGHQRYKIALRDVTASEKIGPHTVRYTFKGDQVRDLPMVVGGLPVLSKDYYEANDFSKTTLSAPLGSGPYRVKTFKQGASITYARRDDYWAKDLPVNRGRYNFDEIKLLFFRDRTLELEALKAGTLDLREEFTSKSWATEYNTAAVEDGRLVKTVLPDHLPSGAQGFFINMRREKFADPRTREALDLAFDFQWTNKNLFYGLYKRTTSVFENSNMKAEGLPSAAELALLEPLAGDFAASALQSAYLPPVSNGSGQDRTLLRRASSLLDAAGWTLKDHARVNRAGEPLTVEFLIFAPTFERVIAPYIRNLKLLGIDASIRQVEAAQYQERLKRFDYDVVAQRFSLALTPGLELRSMFGSQTATMNGSYNLSGMGNHAVDVLIERIAEAGSRAELVTAARALDRVLRAERFWVPHWYKASHGMAYWDIFARPDKKPEFARAILDTWWIDEAKAKTMKKGP